MTEQADTTTTTCRYPGCQHALAPARGQPGRPPEYCEDPGHNRVTAWRERRRLHAEQQGIVTSAADDEQPVTMARVSGAELLREMRAMSDRLAGVAGRLAEAAATGAPPTPAQAERAGAEEGTA